MEDEYDEEEWEEIRPTWDVGTLVMDRYRLEEKIGYYRALHDHTDLWVTPGGGPVNGNSVFPVALELLP